MFVEAPDAHNGVLFEDKPLTDKEIRHEIVYGGDQLTELSRLLRYNLNLVADAVFYGPLDRVTKWFYRTFFRSWEKVEADLKD